MGGDTGGDFAEEDTEQDGQDEANDSEALQHGQRGRFGRPFRRLDPHRFSPAAWFDTPPRVAWIRSKRYQGCTGFPLRSPVQSRLARMISTRRSGKVRRALRGRWVECPSKARKVADVLG